MGREMEIEGSSWVIVVCVAIVAGLIGYGIWAGHDSATRNGHKEQAMWQVCIDHGKDPVTCRVAMNINH